MKKIVLTILSTLMLIIPVISFASSVSKTYNILPETGYRIVDVKVNGVSQGAITSYTFTNIKGTQRIQVITEKIAEEVEQTYTVTFDANGGDGSVSSQTFTEGVPQNLTTNTFTRDGYIFAGWSTTANGSVEYADGASYTATADITLYAAWTTDSYTITYNLDGGSAEGNPTTYSVTTEDITLNNPTKTGHTFTGWTGSNGSTPSTTVTIAKGSIGNKTYTANWSANTYTVTFNANGGSGTMSAQTFTYGVAQNLTANTFTRDGYTFAGWATGASGSVEYVDGASYTATENTTLYSIWEVFEWNSPVLGTGLTPVNWSGSAWVTTTEDAWDYNYDIATAGHGTVAGDGTGKWANAQTSDGSLYVWIPRYTYKITSGNHASGNSWSSVDSAGSNKIEVKFSNGTTDDTSDSYKSHPAFSFGTDKLEGIWVAKYEASRNDATSSSAGSGTTVTIKPGVRSWRSISVSDAYDYAYNMNRTLDSHLMKNIEWGAVAYLTNAVGKIPYINNSSNFITGIAGGSQDASYASETTNAWNTANGVKGSTTHNVYGIYDMSGGTNEYVATYLADVEEGTNSNISSFETNRGTKYVEAYLGNVDEEAYSSSKTGDAVYETSSGYYSYYTLEGSSSASWDGDYSRAPNLDYPVFLRGGRCDNTSHAGIFYFGCDGGQAYANYGFRPVLAIP